MKPNVCAYGVAIVAGREGLEAAFGTSFSTPLTSGFAACAWQTTKSSNNMEMFKKIEQSADLYPYYDYAHGYGVPQAGFFLTNEIQKNPPTFSIVISESTMKVIIDRNIIDLSKETDDPILYYHIENTKGYLDKYYMIAVKHHEVLSFNINEFKKGSVLRIFFKGYCLSHNF